MRYHLTFFIGLILLFSSIIQGRCIVKNSKQEIEINYRIVDANEAATLLLSNRNFFENLTQNDLNYRMQKLNTTLEEYESFVKKQTLNFTENEKKLIDDSIRTIKKNCKKYGYTLPPANDIIFAKTTSLEEDGMEGYTHGTQIYLTQALFDYDKFYRDTVIAHELFHCLTRNNPKFRKEMYSILGFNVLDKDFEFPKETLDLIFSNPDVEHHDSYATFDINGEKKNCTLIFSTNKPFEKPGDHFYDNDNPKTCLVPIDDLSTIYSEEDALNFKEIFNGTSYTIDPEEALADIFSNIAIFDEISNDAPDIFKNINSYLKSYKH